MCDKKYILINLKILLYILISYVRKEIELFCKEQWSGVTMALTQARRFRKRLIPETHRCLLGLERVVNRDLSFLRFVQGISHSVDVPIYFRANFEGRRNSGSDNIIKFIDCQ